MKTHVLLPSKLSISLSIKEFLTSSPVKPSMPSQKGEVQENHEARILIVQNYRIRLASWRIFEKETYKNYFSFVLLKSNYH